VKYVARVDVISRDGPRRVDESAARALARACTCARSIFGPLQIKGYWSVIREGDDWKIRMLTTNVAPAEKK
jgi:hypothetical protein